MTLVHKPLPAVGTVNPVHIDPDRLARAHARRAVKTLNPDAVILRARRVATRGLPEVASLDCGCNRDDVCDWAARLYLHMWFAPPDFAVDSAEEFVEHRRDLFPRALVRPRLSEAGVAAALRQVGP